MKLIVAILMVTVVPICAQAQTPSATKADAQKVVAIIKGDKVKTEAYCDLAKLGVQAKEAKAKNDSKTADELSAKMAELTTKVGPEYLALMSGIQNNPNAQDVQEIGAELSQAAQTLCAK